MNCDAKFENVQTARDQADGQSDERSLSLLPATDTANRRCSRNCWFEYGRSDNGERACPIKLEEIELRLCTDAHHKYT